MSTLPRTACAEGAAYVSSVAQVIPDTTPPPRLRELQRRYTNQDDEVIHTLPAHYTAAILARIGELLGESVAEDAA
jgi:hypothetical protein